MEIHCDYNRGIFQILTIGVRQAPTNADQVHLYRCGPAEYQHWLNYTKMLMSPNKFNYTISTESILCTGPLQGIGTKHKCDAVPSRSPSLHRRQTGNE